MNNGGVACSWSAHQLSIQPTSPVRHPGTCVSNQDSPTTEKLGMANIHERYEGIMVALVTDLIHPVH